MKKFVLNGVEFTNFGSNNYSNGMELITCYPMPENMVQRVLNGEFHGVYLNPSAPCGAEFYGVFGTRDQYKELYERQKGAQIYKAIIDMLGGFDKLNKVSESEYQSAKEKAQREYKDWWA